MAGIGFELRRIFGKKTLVSQLSGVIYASFATLGTSLIFILLLFGIRFLLDYYQVGELDALFFISSFTYLFLVALLISAFFNTVLSRYISDQVFEQKEEDICASVFGMLTIGGICSGIVLFLFCIRMYQKGCTSIPFLCVYYLLGILATNAYNLVSYVSALKEYRRVTLAYFAGIVSAVPAFLIYHAIGLELIFSAYLALMTAFFFVNLFLVYCCVRAFGKPSRNYFAFLKYFREYPTLALSGFFYMLGFFCSNIVYWFGSDINVIINIFRTAPSYDLAMFLAILVNMPSAVIFVVKTETAFYERYVGYLSAINKASYDIIEKERQNMQNTLKLQLFFLYEVQLIITIVAVCLANVLFPYLGISVQVLNLFLLLAFGVYCTCCLQYTMIVLYYFNDWHGAFLSAMIYFGVTVVASVICAVISSWAYYPIPLLLGGSAGWIFSYLLLRRRLKCLNAKLMC